MSVQAITWALAQDITSSGEKLVLVVLANYAGADGTCFPGQKRLAADASMGLRTLQRHIKALEENGYIDRAERRRENGTRSSDTYRLLMHDANLAGGAPEAKKQGANLASDPGSKAPKLTQSHAKLAGQLTVREPSDSPPMADGENSVFFDDENAEFVDAPSGDLNTAERWNRCWVIPVAWVAWAKEHAPDVDTEHENRRFKLHWRQDTSPRAWKRNWFEAWKKWVTNDYAKKRDRNADAADDSGSLEAGLYAAGLALKGDGATGSGKS